MYRIVNVTPSTEDIFKRIDEQQFVKDPDYNHKLGKYTPMEFNYEWNRYYLLCKDNKVIGITRIMFYIGMTHAELRYVIILKKYRNSYATIKLLNIIYHEAFFNLGIDKLESTVYGSNSTSLDIQRKIMVSEGTERESIYVNGIWEDYHHFGLFKHEYIELLEKYPKLRR